MKANTVKTCGKKMMGMTTLAILFSFLCFNATATSSASIKKDLVINELIIQEHPSVSSVVYPFYKKTLEVSHFAGNIVFISESSCLLCIGLEHRIALQLRQAVKTTRSFSAPSKFAQHKILSPDGEEDSVSSL